MPTYHHAVVGFSELKKSDSLKTKAVLASVLGGIPIEDTLLAATQASLHLKVKRVQRLVKKAYPFRGYYDKKYPYAAAWTSWSTYPYIPLKHHNYSYIPELIDAKHGFKPAAESEVKNTLLKASHAGALDVDEYADIAYRCIKLLLGSPRKVNEMLQEDVDYTKISSACLAFGGQVSRQDDPLWDKYVHAFFTRMAEPTAPRMHGSTVSLFNDLFLVYSGMMIHKHQLSGTFIEEDIGKVTKTLTLVPNDKILYPTWQLSKVVSTTTLEVLTLELGTTEVWESHPVKLYGMVITQPDPSMLFVPLDQTILDKFSRKERNTIIDNSLCLAYASTVSTHISGWREAVGTLLLVTSFALVLVGIPPVFAAFEVSISFGLAVLAVTVLVTYLEMKLGEMVAKFLVEEFGAKKAGIVIIAAVISALSFKNANALSTSLWLSGGYGAQMERMQADIELFTNRSEALYQEAMDKLTEKQEQLDKMKETSKYILHLMLDPTLIYPGESVESYISRSKSLSRLPISFVKESNNFVTEALALPKA